MLKPERVFQAWAQGISVYGLLLQFFYLQRGATALHWQDPSYMEKEHTGGGQRRTRT